MTVRHTCVVTLVLMLPREIFGDSKNTIKQVDALLTKNQALCNLNHC